MSIANGQPPVPVFEIGQSVASVLQALNASDFRCGVACHKDRRYAGIIDRELLSSRLADEPILAEANLNQLGSLPAPFLREDSTPLDIRRALLRNGMPVVPFVDHRGRLTDVFTIEQALRHGLHDNAVVIMAGGFGTRMRPLTESMPKPMVPLLAGQRLLDRVVDHLIACGFHRFYVAVHYMKDQIMDYLGNGINRGVTIEYLVEASPQGTAGSLRGFQLREKLPLIVTNGDVVTNQDVSALLRFHHENDAQVTMMCKEENVDISYGVVECAQDDTLISIQEKPRLSYLINAGLYVIEPDTIHLIPVRSYWITDLIDEVRKEGGKVCVFRTHDYWRDVGTMNCYTKVIQDLIGGHARNYAPGANE